MNKYNISSRNEYDSIYLESINNPEEFWSEIASDNFIWKKKWDKVLDWDFKKAKVSWFKGAQLNITENCIDRHLEKKGNKMINIAGKMRLNEWGGKRKIDFMIEDVSLN